MWARVGDAEGIGYFSLKAKSPKIAWLLAYLFNCDCLLVFVNVVVAVVVVVVFVVAVVVHLFH